MGEGAGHCLRGSAVRAEVGEMGRGSAFCTPGHGCSRLLTLETGFGVDLETQGNQPVGHVPQRRGILCPGRAWELLRLGWSLAEWAPAQRQAKHLGPCARAPTSAEVNQQMNLLAVQGGEPNRSRQSSGYLPSVLPKWVILISESQHVSS